MNDYQNIIVNKPWGYEYLMYLNDQIGLWYLFIRCGAQTSLHCYPKKKTGLIILSGEAEVRFMNDAVKLQPLNKLMIRAGLFHSTTALSPEGAVVLEVETPPIKTNLVRFDDPYGRKEEPCEGDEAIVPMDNSCVRLHVPEEGRGKTCSLHGYFLTPERVKDLITLEKRCPKEFIVVVGGGLISRTSEFVLSPGDVVTIGTLNRLAETFTAPEGIVFLTISKEVNNCAQDTG